MQQMLSSIRSTAGDAYIFQQDSASAHCARQMVKLLQHETPKFTAPDLWPPSPYLHPINYQIGGVMHHCVYHVPVRDVNDLKKCLTDTWNELSQSIVDDAVDEWWKRLTACVKEKGGHFKHLLQRRL